MASNKRIDQIREKGKLIRGKNSNVGRKGLFNNKIPKASHGTKVQYGWEFDCKNPKSKGRSDKSQNIQPIHWEENRNKSSKYPYEKG